jgi:hypothetical protein
VGHRGAPTQPLPLRDTPVSLTKLHSPAETSHIVFLLRTTLRNGQLSELVRADHEEPVEHSAGAVCVWLFPIKGLGYKPRKVESRRAGDGEVFATHQSTVTLPSSVLLLDFNSTASKSQFVASYS